MIVKDVFANKGDLPDGYNMKDCGEDWAQLPDKEREVYKKQAEVCTKHGTLEEVENAE